jgi:hypothetical protein
VRKLVSTTYEAFASRMEAGDEIVVRLLTEPAVLRLTDSLSSGETLLSGETDAAAQTLDRITAIILSRLAARGQLAIHGAAVVHSGGAVVISGPSGSGKTTLALGLVERGMSLLSDEMAVIESDGRVLPYRRSLHIRPGTPEMLSDADLVRHTLRFDTGNGEKWSVTPRQLAAAIPGSLAEASPMSHVLLVGDQPTRTRPASLSPMPPALAAVELCRSAPAAGRQFPAVLSRLGALLDGVRCARLELGALPDALDLVCAWLTDGETEQRHPTVRSEPSEAHRVAARLGLFELYRRNRELIWVRGAGDSMRPLLRPDDQVLVEFGSQPRRAGDVVVFADRGQIVAHRVLAIRDGGARLVLKGDGSRWFDASRAATDILGVVRAHRRSEYSRGSLLGLSGPPARLIARLSLLIGFLAQDGRSR